MNHLRTFVLALVLPAFAACQHSSPTSRADGGQSGCSIKEFPIPTPDAQPIGIVVGPDGNLWFTEASANKIGRITPAGKLDEFAVPTPESSPNAIVAGADGSLWFAEGFANKIGRVTTSGTITETALTPPAGDTFVLYLTNIMRGPDDAIWFTEERKSSVGRIDVTGALNERQAPIGLGLSGMAAGPDGKVWIACTSAGSIVTLDSAWKSNSYPLPTPNAAPDNIVVGSDGNLWFTTSTYYGAVAEIGRITTAGEIAEFPFPSGSEIEGIAAGTDGLWFTESHANSIGHIAFDGEITECPIPTASSGPNQIVVGPDGAVWFTEYDGNQIGRLATR